MWLIPGLADLQAIKGSQELLEKKQKQLAEFVTTYKIQVKGSDELAAASANQGVLVS